MQSIQTISPSNDIVSLSFLCNAKFLEKHNYVCQVAVDLFFPRMNPTNNLFIKNQSSSTLLHCNFDDWRSSFPKLSEQSRLPFVLYEIERALFWKLRNWTSCFAYFELLPLTIMRVLSKSNRTQSSLIFALFFYCAW